MKPLRRLLMGFFLTLIVVGVVYSVVTAARAMCCEYDLNVFQSQLAVATSLNIIISTVLSRLKFRARGWRWLLMSIALTTTASAVWTLTYWAARATGLANRDAALSAYLMSLASLGVTALFKYDETDETPVEPAKRKRRR